MKLYKYKEYTNESIEDNDFKEGLEDIRSVLLDLKDEYGSLDGDIYVPDNTSKFFEIVLDCRYFIGEDVEKVEKNEINYMKKKVKFIEYTIGVVERMERVTGRKSFISDLWEFDKWQNDFKINIKLY